MTIESFAPLIRLREVLKEKGWLSDVRLGENGTDGLDLVNEKKMESLIASLL